MGWPSSSSCNARTRKLRHDGNKTKALKSSDDCFDRTLKSEKRQKQHQTNVSHPTKNFGDIRIFVDGGMNDDQSCSRGSVRKQKKNEENFQDPMKNNESPNRAMSSKKFSRSYSCLSRDDQEEDQDECTPRHFKRKIKKRKEKIELSLETDDEFQASRMSSDHEEITSKRDVWVTTLDQPDGTNVEKQRRFAFLSEEPPPMFEDMLMPRIICCIAAVFLSVLIIWAVAKLLRYFDINFVRSSYLSEVEDMSTQTDHTNILTISSEF